MKIKMKVREKFQSSDGIAILACSGHGPKLDVIGKTLSLVHGNEVRQTLTISSERKMLNQKSHLDQRAFETNDTVLLSREEALSGAWQLVGG